MKCTRAPKYAQIAIWGHFHGGNQGDDIVVSSLIRELRARQPDAEVVAFSLNPADTRERHGIEAFPLTRGAQHSRLRRRAGEARPERRRSLLRARAWDSLDTTAQRAWRSWRRLRRRLRRWLGALSEPAFVWRSWRRLRDVDVLIVAGSGPLYDGWNGAWVHPYNLFKWSMLARLAGTPVHMLSVGAGPIRSRLSRFFLGHALRNAEYVSLRDESSKQLVERLGLIQGCPVLPDQAFALELRRPALPPRDRIVVGVNPMAHEDPRYLPRGKQTSFDAYLAKLAGFVAWMLAERYEVRLFYSALADLRVCEELELQLRADGVLAENESLIHQEILHADQLVGEMVQCDFVVAARFHCILLPASMGIPVIGLAYHPKTVDLLKALGQHRYASHIDRFGTPQLVDFFCDLRAHADEVRDVLAARVPECRKAVREQYDDLYGPVVES